MRISVIASLLASWFLAAPALAFDEPATQTRLIADTSSRADNHFWAGVEFIIPKDWHIYWQNPGDSGIPTSLAWTTPKNITAQAIHWPVPERQPMADLVNYGYSHQVVLPVPMKVKDNTDISGTLEVKANWLICKDVCIPQSATLSAALDAPASDTDKTLLAEALANVPNIYRGEAFITADNTHVTLAIQHNGDDAALFPIDDGWFKNNALPIIERRGVWLLFTLPRGSAPVADTFTGVIAAGGKAAQFSAKYVASLPDSIPAAVPTLALLPALLLAFLGGLILNLMPCVLPVLALKALSLSKKSDATPRDALRLGLSYTAGVLLSFALIGAALLALKAGGAAIGWGFQLQSPAFVLALITIVTLVALNLAGLFELPVLFGSLGHETTARNSALGSFTTGVLAVALATPCTAPFMAPALGAALTLPAASSMLVFLALGAGLAAPYLLICVSARARRLLPKPGPWMLRFKEFLAFPMFATAAWLLWVLTQQAGNMALIHAFALLLALALALWGLKHATTRLWRGIWWALIFVAIGYSVLNPPRGLSAPTATETSSMGEAFTPAKLAALRAEGRAVFVDATADWCITCKINERVALRSESTRALFAENNITLLVADWTRRDADITAWLASFGRNGVPLYVYYPPHGEPRVLPQLLTPSLIHSAVTQP